VLVMRNRLVDAVHNMAEWELAGLAFGAVAVLGEHSPCCVVCDVFEEGALGCVRY